MDAAIRLELARPTDAQTIALMSRDLIEYGLPWRWRTGSVLHLVHDLDSAVLIAQQAGPVGRQLCGFAIMSFNWERADAHLVLLAVRPALRRRGLGRALVRWLEVVARRGGIRRIELEVRANRRDARGFYRSLGYREAGRIAGYYQGFEDAVRMVSALRASASAR